MERDCESELSKLNIEQNACIYHFGASVIHGQRSNILRLPWLDTGTHESLVEATNFVKTVEDHQHRKIACLEEIAYLNGWISKEVMLKTYEVLKKNQYGHYLKDVLDGKYIDVLH